MRGELFYPPRIFGAIPPVAADLEKARVVILPVPYDSTTGYRSGARDGPQAIIDASQNLELYDRELDKETYQVGIHTLPEVEPVMSGPEAMIHRVREVTSALLEKERLVVMLGGEHSLTIGTVQAYKGKYPNLSVLHLDAHADLRDEYLGSRYSHGCAMRRVGEICPVVSAGVRSLSQEEGQFVKEHHMPIFYAETFSTAPGYLRQVVSLLSPKIYVSIDLDVFDPSIMAAVGTPEPGGLGWYEVLALLREVAQQRQIVGFDLVEFCPREGPIACAFLAAKLVYKLIGYTITP
ncbi:MAG: agmatinase [Chloroflexi bacterium]|nr:agmatinase [Chloroflexota bacterium]